MMKKVLPVLLALLLVMGLAVPAMAVRNEYEIAEILPEFYTFYNYEGNPSVNPEETRPGDEIIIPLVRDGFQDANGALIDWAEIKPGEEHLPPLGPSIGQLAQNSVTANIIVTKGSRVIRDVTIVKYTPTRSVRAQSAIRIRFVEDLVSTEEIRWEFTVRLEHKRSGTGCEETFGGLIYADTFDIEYDNDYAHLADGSIGRCISSADNINVDIGAGIWIKSNLVAGEKYYGRARYEANLEQDPILKQYKEIDGMYNVYTINLQTGGTPVKINFDDGVTYYVYNQFGTYIGTSQEWLPYSTKYYFASEKVDIEIDPSLLIPAETDKHMSAAVSAFTEGLLKG